MAGERGFDRPISWGRIQRPGLALAGFLSFIKPGRIQVLGESELNYLDTMPGDAPPRADRGHLRPAGLGLRRDEGPGRPGGARPGVQSRATSRSSSRRRRRRSSSSPSPGSSRTSSLRPPRCTASSSTCTGWASCCSATPGSARASRPSTSSSAATGWSPTTSSRSASTRTARSWAARRTCIRYHMELRGIGIINIKHLFGVSRGARVQVDRARHRARAVGPDEDVRPARHRRGDVLRSSIARART